MKRVLLGAVALITGGVWNKHWTIDVEESNSCYAIFFLFWSLPLCLLVHFRQADASTEQAVGSEMPRYLGLMPGLGGG